MTSQEKRLAREIRALKARRDAHWHRGEIRSLERRQAAITRNKHR